MRNKNIPQIRVIGSTPLVVGHVNLRSSHRFMLCREKAVCLKVPTASHLNWKEQNHGWRASHFHFGLTRNRGLYKDLEAIGIAVSRWHYCFLLVTL